MCILIAEDEPLILIGLCNCFEDAGYIVMAAEHGQGAIDHVECHPGQFTCLVTDLHMPGLVLGIHVVEHMRPRYPDIPMIMTTALPHTVDKGWQAEHAVRMVAKPYDPDVLVGTIQRLLAD